MQKLLPILFALINIAASAGIPCKKCDLDKLAILSRHSDSMTMQMVEDFLCTFDSSCNNNVEYREWSNKLLFTVLEKVPHIFFQVTEKGQLNQAILLVEIENPMHDAIPLEKIYNNIKTAHVQSGIKKKYLEAVISAAGKMGQKIKDTLPPTADSVSVSATDTASAFIKGIKMNTEEFWKIIDHSFSASEGNKNAQQSILLRTLDNYTGGQIIEFEIILRRLIIEADDYKVMAAEKIIEGSVTDDPYLYFRCWLISRGRKTFEETLKNPDYLADKVYRNTDVWFEELLYITTTAYSNKTGKLNEDETFPRSVAYNQGLDYDSGAPPTKGKDWTEDQLPKLYPKLWSKFH